MGPVFEHALVDALGLMQIRASIFGDAVPEDVMVAALDHMDGVDLHIAEMFDGRRRCLRPAAERRLGIEPLGAQPGVPAAALLRETGLSARDIARQSSRIREFQATFFPRNAAIAAATSCRDQLEPPDPIGFARWPMLPVAISASHAALPRSGALHL